ncbi:MAG: hypothetical protein WED05_01840 [Candidatus Atabeyarchaeum deiterrae]
MATIEFRIATAEEKRTIMKRIDDLFGKDVASKTIGSMEVIMANGKRVELFLVPQKVLSIFKKTEGKHNPYCLGVYVGDLVNNEFLPSIEGATLISPHTNRKMRVSMKGEQTILYGRDVKRSFVKEAPYDAHKGERVVITNVLDETIALGKMSIDRSKFNGVSKQTLVAENIIDRGWYLREGK